MTSLEENDENLVVLAPPAVTMANMTSLQENEMLLSGLASISPWSNDIPSMNQKRDLHAAVAIDKFRFMVIGGRNGNEYLDSVEIFNRKTNEFEFGPSLNQARSRHAAARVENKIYVFGGWGGLVSIECLDLSVKNSKWKLLNTKLTCQRDGCTAAVVGHLIYIIGRQGESSVDILDTRTDTIRQGPSITTKRKGSGAAVVGTTIFVFGGSYYEKPSWKDLDTIECLNVASTNAKWKLCQGIMSEPKWFMGLVVLGNGCIIILGGHNGNNYLLTVEMYDPNRDVCFKLPNMTTPRWGPAAVALDNTVYVMGGFNSQDKHLDSIEFMKVNCKETAKELMKQGDALYQIGQCHEALQKYKEALNTNPSSADCWSNLAACHEKLGQCEEMVKASTKCLELDGTFVKGYYQLATSQKELGDIDASLATIEAGLAMFPEDVELKNIKAELLATARDASQAHAVGQDSFQTSPNIQNQNAEWLNRVDSQKLQRLEAIFAMDDGVLEQILSTVESLNTSNVDSQDVNSFLCQFGQVKTQAIAFLEDLSQHGALASLANYQNELQSLISRQQQDDADIQERRVIYQRPKEYDFYLHMQWKLRSMIMASECLACGMVQGRDSFREGIKMVVRSGIPKAFSRISFVKTVSKASQKILKQFQAIPGMEALTSVVAVLLEFADERRQHVAVCRVAVFSTLLQLQESNGQGSLTACVERIARLLVRARDNMIQYEQGAPQTKSSPFMRNVKTGLRFVLGDIATTDSAQQGITAADQCYRYILSPPVDCVLYRIFHKEGHDPFSTNLSDALVASLLGIDMEDLSRFERLDGSTVGLEVHEPHGARETSHAASLNRNNERFLPHQRRNHDDDEEGTEMPSVPTRSNIAQHNDNSRQHRAESNPQDDGESNKAAAATATAASSGSSKNEDTENQEVENSNMVTRKEFSQLRAQVQHLNAAKSKDKKPSNELNVGGGQAMAHMHPLDAPRQVEKLERVGNNAAINTHRLDQHAQEIAQQKDDTYQLRRDFEDLEQTRHLDRTEGRDQIAQMEELAAARHENAEERFKRLEAENEELRQCLEQTQKQLEGKEKERERKKGLRFWRSKR